MTFGAKLMLTKLRASENLKISWRLRPLAAEKNMGPQINQTADHSIFQIFQFTLIIWQIVNKPLSPQNQHIQQWTTVRLFLPIWCFDHQKHDSFFHGVVFCDHQKPDATLLHFALHGCQASARPKRKWQGFGADSTCGNVGPHLWGEDGWDVSTLLVGGLETEGSQCSKHIEFWTSKLQSFSIFSSQLLRQSRLKMICGIASGKAFWMKTGDNTGHGWGH